MGSWKLKGFKGKGRRRGGGWEGERGEVGKGDLERWEPGEERLWSLTEIFPFIIEVFLYDEIGVKI